MKEHVTAALASSAETLRKFGDVAGDVMVRVAAEISRMYDRRGTLFLFGNGGSAADAQHIATELVVRFRSDRERPPLAAIALTTNTSLITAAANDYGYDAIFARQIAAQGRSGDVAIGISTSGNSPSILCAFEACRKAGLVTVLLGGGTGGKAKALADHAIIVPSTETARIQEAHIACGHILVDLIERMRYPDRIA